MGEVQYKSSLEVAVASMAYRQIAVLVLQGASKGRISLPEVRTNVEAFLKDFIGHNLSYEDEADAIRAGLNAVDEFFSSIQFGGAETKRD